jgi:hypothetical protein
VVAPGDRRCTPVEASGARLRARRWSSGRAVWLTLFRRVWYAVLFAAPQRQHRASRGGQGTPPSTAGAGVVPQGCRGTPRGSHRLFVGDSRGEAVGCQG